MKKDKVPFNRTVPARMTSRQVAMLDKLARKSGQNRSGVIRTLIVGEYQEKFTWKERNE